MNFKAFLCSVLVFLGLATTASAQLPRFGKAIVIVEENTGFTRVIGNPVIPYLNGLANSYGLATNYFANTHPSIGNYFMLTTGETVTNDDNFNGVVDIDNIVRQLVLDGRTWKCYAEALPAVGYLGGDVGPYTKHHNPFAYFTDVINDPAQQQNLVPFSQFALDLAAGTLPDFSFIIPNDQNNGHSCPAGMVICTGDDRLANLDNWLQTNIDPLVNSAVFQSYSLLAIVFDEGNPGDTTNGGGHVATVLVSPLIKTPGYRGRDLYQHQNLLRTIAAGLGLTGFPGSSAFVSDMAQFFAYPIMSCPVKTSNKDAVSICYPADGSTLVSPIRVYGIALMENPILSTQLIIDGLIYDLPVDERMTKFVYLTPGPHQLTLQATDIANNAASSTITVNIVSK